MQTEKELSVEKWALNSKIIKYGILKPEDLEALKKEQKEKFEQVDKCSSSRTLLLT